MTGLVRGVTAAVLLAALAAGCARPAPQSHADAVSAAACRRHADAVYQMREPDSVYRSDTYATSTRDAPFAGPGVAGATSDALGQQYERGRIVDDCLRLGGTAPEPEAPAGPQ